MSNARMWCKLTDGGQIILIITNKQSLRNLTKFFFIQMVMMSGLVESGTAKGLGVGQTGTLGTIQAMR